MDSSDDEIDTDDELYRNINRGEVPALRPSQTANFKGKQWAHDDNNDVENSSMVDELADDISDKDQMDIDIGYESSTRSTKSPRVFIHDSIGEDEIPTFGCRTIRLPGKTRSFTCPTTRRMT